METERYSLRTLSLVRLSWLDKDLTCYVRNEKREIIMKNKYLCSFLNFFYVIMQINQNKKKRFQKIFNFFSCTLYPTHSRVGGGGT